MDTDEDLLKEFVSHINECIHTAEQSLLALEKNRHDLASVNACMRVLHTIKGTSSCLGIPSISQIAHRLESILNRVRTRELDYDGVHADLTLRSLDLIKSFNRRSLAESLTGRPLAHPAGYAEILAELKTACGAAGGEALPGPAGEAPGAQVREPREAGARPPPPISPHGSESTMRVRTDRLESLAAVAVELAIAHSLIAEDAAVQHDGNRALRTKVTRTGEIVRELRDLCNMLRMLPMRNTFQILARLVRDLAQKSGKSIRLVTTGDETEIDRSMVDIIDVPLVHMVRNAVDHGIEDPGVRERNGKPRQGTIVLAASQEQSDLVIEVRDDGRGLDREKIRCKAVSLHLIDPETPIPDPELYELIFAPGLSTADKVTEISGRGMGMDIVKRNVESLRGRVEIESAPGRGSTFRLSLPVNRALPVR